jgi:hypothetical protein
MYWVIIETGSNQRYIFATNKQRLQVAASAAVWQLGFVWIEEAIRGVALSYCRDLAEFEYNARDKRSVMHVVKASGRAVLLVHTAEDGRAIITAVTRRALEEKTGIDVWGRVSEPIDAGFETAGDRFFETDVLLREQRTKRLPPTVRFPTLPFHEQCAYTGLPAATVGKEVVGENPKARSDVTEFLFEKATGARQRLLNELHGEEVGLTSEEQTTAKRCTVQMDQMWDGVRNNGWVAAIHADGNGIGKIFANLRITYPDGRTFVEKQKELSDALEKLTWKALRDTVLGIDRTDQNKGRTVWPNRSILPIIVGGDDISAAAHGGIAFEFAALLVANFGHYARADELGLPFITAFDDIRAKLPTLDDVPKQLSLAVGLVFTKPNHPFSHSISLAEELTSSAKKHSKRRTGAIDSLVLYESAVRGLADIRDLMTIPEGRTEDDDTNPPTTAEAPGKPVFSYAGKPIIVNDEHGELMTVGEVRKLIDELSPRPDADRPAEQLPGQHHAADSVKTLSRRQIQDLRPALTEPRTLAGVTDQLRLVRARIDLSGNQIPGIVAEELRIDPAAGKDSTMFVTALDLAVVRAGTVEGNARANDDNPVPTAATT